MSTTLIEDINNAKHSGIDNRVLVFTEMKRGDILKTTLDFSEELSTRIQAINALTSDELVEVITKISSLYQISGTRGLRSYLHGIAVKSSIDPSLKSMCAKTLHEYNKNDELAYSALSEVYPLLRSSTVGTPIKIDVLRLLVQGSEENVKQAEGYFSEIINNQSLDYRYREKIIFSIGYTAQDDSKIEKEREERVKRFQVGVCRSFFEEKKNNLRSRIIIGKFLLSSFLCDQEAKNTVEQEFLSISEDTGIEYNRRADAVDCILSSLNNDVRTRAKVVLRSLGFGERKIATLYDNAQNVHNEGVEKSVGEALKFLSSIEIRVNLSETEIKKAENAVVGLVLGTDEKSIEKRSRITLAFDRIHLDKTLYGEMNLTLSRIFMLVWSYVLLHKSKDDILKRLVEELDEMSDTCSSGFVSRLVNVISGFGDFSLTISWRDQIIANFSGRLNAKVRDMDNLELQEYVMEEMMVQNSSHERRKHFLGFLRNNVLGIREEMYEEYRTHISDSDFDLYFKGAVLMYEIGERGD